MAKAWQHIGAIGRRTFWDPQTVLVVGAGPIGLLAALIGVSWTGPPQVPNLPWSNSGAPATTPSPWPTWWTPIQLARQAMDTVSPGIICPTGVGSPAVPDTVSATTLSTDVVLKNIAVFGSVNANRRHCYRAAKVPMGLVRFPDGKVQHDRGPCRRARVTLGWVMTRPQSAATLAAG